MYRVRIYLMGLLALFFSSSNTLFAGVPVAVGTDGTCYAYSASTGSLYMNSGTRSYTGDFNNGIKSGWLTAVGTVYRANYASFYYDVATQTWVSKYTWNNFNVSPEMAERLHEKYGTTSVAGLNSSYPNGCVLPVCDTADDDEDGVCNSCDTSPGLPDPKHCIYVSWEKNGVVTAQTIDQSGKCDGSDLTTLKNDSLADPYAGAFGSINEQSQEVNPPTCAGDDGSGGCSCGYGPNSGVFSGLTPDPDTIVSEALKEQLQKAKEAAEDKEYDDCSNIKARCEAACISRGGVVTNTCSVDGDTTYAECKCQNEFGFDIATPTEDSGDTNSTTADTDGDGIPDSQDSTTTGGNDSNNDGVDDTYAAVKGALDGSGIASKINSTNTHLNSIGNKLDGLNSSVNGVGSAINGVGDGINSVGEGINGLGTKLDGIADKIDELGEGENGDITATGSADLPGSNEYDAAVEELEEISLAETIGSYISDGLPIVSYFQGTYINIGSAQPSMSTEIMGRTITIDFSGVESILNNMGLVLVAVSTVLAFMIIVHKG